jgi:glycine/D-amino acid oxidase-like deaminating enzyme
VFDFIIVGQGIAGSMLAWFLSKANQSVIILDEFNPASASQVASGVINPITGKRLVKSWRSDELIPFARRTYQELEGRLGIKVLSETVIHRIFSNQEDFQFYRQKKELDELPENVKPLKEIPSCFRDVQFGGVEIHGVHLLDYPFLLSAMRKWFLEKNMLWEEKFEFNELHLKNGEVLYKDLQATKIIFCEGNGASLNPYFSWLPFNLAKGEVITVSMPDFPEDKIWHKGIFIAPIESGLFRVGATYEWDFKDAFPSEKGRAELEKKLKRAVNLSFEVVDHVAAIRPTVKDRRPLIGLYSEFPQAGIFNGMGTKGASLSPFFAHHFADFLLQGKKLDAEIDINRFLKENEIGKESERENDD